VDLTVYFSPSGFGASSTLDKTLTFWKNKLTSNPNNCGENIITAFEIDQNMKNYYFIELFSFVHLKSSKI
jgi:hypothetical protein